MYDFKPYDTLTALRETGEWIKKYATLRRKERGGEHVDLSQYQEIREQLGEALFHFGPTVAELKSEVLRTKSDYDLCLAKSFVRLKESSGKESMEVLRNKAKIECEKEMRDYVEAYELSSKARQVEERVDQVLNGIASRFRVHSKYDRSE